MRLLFIGQIIVGAAVLATLGKAACGDPSHGPDRRPIVSATIDFLDYAFFKTDPAKGYFTEQQYEDIIKKLADTGIRKLYLRVNACGLTLYPTKAGRMFTADDHVQPGATYLANTLGKYDALAKTVELGHKYGLAVWAWENLWDDEATCNEIDPTSDAPWCGGSIPQRRLFEQRGTVYLLKDPFLVANPRYQWALDPRVNDRAAKLDKQLRNVPITKIVVTSAVTGRACRITADDVAIYTSSDNKHYRPYTQGFKFSAAQRNGKNILTFDKISITDPYVKLIHKKPFPTDDSYSVTATDPKSCGTVYSGGKQITVSWDYRDQTEPFEQGGFLFVTNYGFAWDYGRYAIGFMKGQPKRQEYYGGVTEFAYPEMRAHKVAKLKELTRYGFDGYVYSLRTHSSIYEPEQYGFNDVIRDKFLKRYGKDIWKQDFDRDAWLDLRADSVDLFLRDAKGVLRGKPLYMNVLSPTSKNYQRFAHLPWHYEKWVKDGSVDGLTMLGFSDPQLLLGKQGGRAVPIMQFCEVRNLHSEEEFKRSLGEYLSNKDIDEVELYEAILLTDSPAYLDVIRALTQEPKDK